jgi:integrase
MAALLYGAGMRREECCRLRLHDLDLGRQQIVIRHDIASSGLKPA